MMDLQAQSTSSFLLDRIGLRVEGISRIDSITPVSGGDINQAYLIDSNKGRFFVKTNDWERFPAMLQLEAMGLFQLEDTNTFRIPSVITTGEHQGSSYLVLEWIEKGSPGPDFWDNFGSLLSRLHGFTDEQFGLNYNNYIGSLKQSNNHHACWASFFAEERIEPLFNKAFDNGHFDQGDRMALEKLLNKLGDIVPRESPALVHGDLWNGNYLVDDNGNAVILDPAIYYGHREADIAMMKLFGGFPQQVFDTYNEQRPLESGWEERVDLHNLYPVLVHLNLFGAGYLQQARNIIQKFS